MHRRPRPIATLTLSTLLAVLLAACGGATGPNGDPDPDPDPDPNGGEPYWEMMVSSGSDDPFEGTGTSVAYATLNVVVLGASDPAGWSVSFTITGDLPVGIPYSTDNDDLLNATVGTPTGPDCVATSETSFALPSFVNLGPDGGGVPVGSGSVYVDGGCGSFVDETEFLVGFGVR